jgi:hypothetical protein
MQVLESLYLGLYDSASIIFPMFNLQTLSSYSKRGHYNIGNQQHAHPFLQFLTKIVVLFILLFFISSSQLLSSHLTVHL